MAQFFTGLAGLSSDTELPVRVAAVCYRLSGSSVEFLLVNTSSGKWTFPKGRLNPGMSASDSASCEAWEEAGIECKIEKDLGNIEEKRTEAQIRKNPSAPRAAYRFYEVRVKEEKDSWPEKHKRDRMWMSYAKAKDLLRDRPELLEALERSSIKR